ncbi:hypothetical protein [Pedobacter sp. SL55]|uniref:hypothetical protein n=1 Tax=Pedobacter sp. SL55 TaxID=2995161 RepID=UPI00226FDE81|nr:hypothetical protein [Pedobacter sp. SL55]WAC41200.1 hypothetical protein OVA16_02155 [Pedobacter sp. SL55]
MPLPTRPISSASISVAVLVLLLKIVVTSKCWRQKEIEPAKTREKLIKAFKMLENKVVNMPRKKHGNIPL